MLYAVKKKEKVQKGPRQERSDRPDAKRVSPLKKTKGTESHTQTRGFGHDFTGQAGPRKTFPPYILTKGQT